MKEEKIFITDNPLLEIETKRRVMMAFEPSKQVARIVTDFGFTLTREIVADCLTLKKVIKQCPVEGATRWVGENADKYAKEFEAVETYEGDEHLKAELSKMLQPIIESNVRTAEKQARAEALRTEYKSMVERIYVLFHTGLRTIETVDFLHYFDVEDGEVVLPKNIDELIKADTATYATTEKGKAAYQLHKQIAEDLNTLADMMKNASRNNFSSNLEALFFEGEDGNAHPMPIDYDLFTN